MKLLFVVFLKRKQIFSFSVDGMWTNKSSCPFPSHIVSCRHTFLWSYTMLQVLRDWLGSKACAVCKMRLRVRRRTEVFISICIIKNTYYI